MGPLVGVTQPTRIGSSTSTSSVTNSSTDRITLKIGLLFPGATSRQRSLLGFGQSAPAINLAIQRARNEHLIDNIDFSFVWYIGDCNQTLQTGYAVELIQGYGVDAIVGPPCSTAAIMSGSVAAFYNTPILIWGPATASTLYDVSQYVTSVSLNTDSNKLALAIRSLLLEYNWMEFAFLYAPDDVQQMCYYLPQDMDTVLAADGSPTIVFKSPMVIGNTTSITQALNATKTRARIIVACFDSDIDKLTFLIAANNLGINTDTDFVFIFPNIRAEGLYSQATDGTPVGYWINATDPTRNGDAQQSARLAMAIDLPNSDANVLNQFAAQVQAYEGQPPFNCTGACMVAGDPDPATAMLTATNTSSTFATSLYDTFYMYALMINRTANVTGLSGDALKQALRNGTLIANGFIAQTEFQGLTGHVVINENGTRDPIFTVSAMDATFTPTSFLNISVSGDTNNVSVIPLYSDASSSIWAARGGKQPVYKPECGYDGTECPVNVALWVGIGVGVLLLLVLVSAAIVLYIVRQRVKQQERLNAESLIPYHALRRIDPKAQSAEVLRSHASFRNSTLLSTASATTQRSTEFSINVEQLETENHAYFHFAGGEVVYAQKYAVQMRFTNEHMIRLRRLREFDHDNANKLLGVCVDGPQLMAVWKYCHRGSLQDVIAFGTFISDSFVMFALMRDIINGLRALHSSSVGGVHGNLTSQCCLVNDRWQLKISDYGLHMISESQPSRRKKLIWRAPELLRSGDVRGTKEGDIYSFGIICSELVNKENAWGGAAKETEIDEIIYRLKKGSDPPFRPELKPHEDGEVNPALLHLIRDCWSENPVARPKLDLIKSLLKQMVKHGEQNLMDYVFSMMEVYANSLEQEVSERTKQLVEEKRKSDILLYRMLPRQVADKLRVGESVQPEQFEAATVLFSDVVSFTVLASRCTPLQVVNLLNELYSTFDNIIDMHDAYKVETIGDGYLIVSGIPRRNGDQHAREIAELALDFMRALPQFRIPHLPNERINLRIGVHTGSAVAGVVGLTMPRYCLFGDTVNTASRMESNGRAGMIHISPDTNTYLTTTIGGYVTELRGEVIIKGKGVMETFWLIGKGDLIDYVDSSKQARAPETAAPTENKPQILERVESTDSH